MARKISIIFLFLLLPVGYVHSAEKCEIKGLLFDLQNQFEKSLDGVLTGLCTITPEAEKDVKQLGEALRGLFTSQYADEIIKKNNWEGRVKAALETLAAIDILTYRDVMRLPSKRGLARNISPNTILQDRRDPKKGSKNHSESKLIPNRDANGWLPDPGSWREFEGKSDSHFYPACPGTVKPSVKPKCRTEAEDQLIQEKIISQIDKKQKELYVNDVRDLRNVLSPLKDIFTRTPKDKKKYLIDSLSSTIRNEALRENPEVFSSTLYYYVNNAVTDVFGGESKVYSSVERVRVFEGGGIKKYSALFSSHPFEGSYQSEYGFWMRKIDKIDKEKAESKLTTEICDKVYQVKHKIEKAKDPKYATAPSPEYDKLWSDNVLTGVVVEGAGFDDLALGRYYQNYYRNQGFEFGAPLNADGKDGKSASEILKGLIESGEADYLVRDSHSGADLVNVLAYDKSAQIIKGEKDLGNGKKEVVYIISGERDDNERLTAANQDKYPNKIRPEDLKEMMKKRENPLMFLNGSCSSMKKVAQEVHTIGDSKLVNIGFSTNTFSFTNSDESTKKLFLDGLRSGQTYQEMRDTMKAKSKRYARRENRKDVLIFPDDPEYKKAVNASNYNLVYEIRSDDGYGDWNNYEISDEVRQH